MGDDVTITTVSFELEPIRCLTKRWAAVKSELADSLGIDDDSKKMGLCKKAVVAALKTHCTDIAFSQADFTSYEVRRKPQDLNSKAKALLEDLEGLDPYLRHALATGAKEDADFLLATGEKKKDFLWRTPNISSGNLKELSAALLWLQNKAILLEKRCSVGRPAAVSIAPLVAELDRIFDKFEDLVPPTSKRQSIETQTLRKTFIVMILKAASLSAREDLVKKYFRRKSKDPAAEALATGN